MRLRIWLAMCIACIAVSGCSNNDVIMKKQMEMEARLEQLVQGSVAANARLAELGNEVKELQAQNRANSAELAQLKPAYGELKSSLEALARKEPADAPAPKIELVNRDAASSDRDAGPQDAYMKAFGLFSSNNYGGAIEAFEAFIRQHPASEFAGNAQYWIGECHYTQRNFAKSLEAFGKVVANYPRGNKVPDAMLKIGFSFISMNEPLKAKAELQSLIEKYPRSPAAAKARERLSRH